MSLTEHAPAKINLSLHVLGRRPDGYHELESLVAFADCGDVLELTPGVGFRLNVAGPFASALDGPNLVARAVEAARLAEPRLRVGVIRLAKHLPIAAGIGGGSADAAAAIRLLRRANPELEASVGWLAIARGIGADVTVCLVSRAAMMRGIGDVVEPLAGGLPPFWCVLVNPGVALATAAVFRELGAPSLSPHGRACGHAAMPVECHPAAPSADATGLLAGLAACRNDLEAPAVRLCPEVAEVLDALGRAPGVRLARMSGSGPTCIGLLETESDAREAAATLSRHRPGWWVKAARLT